MSVAFSDFQHPETATDDWRATATRDSLRARARLLKAVRSFFEVREVLEVETPILSAATNTDPSLQSMITQYCGPGFPHGKKLYLQTSPESAMKRLLASGSGSIFQVCKTFRDGEAGRLHNPEFTLLEWYRVGYDHHMLMNEVEEFVATMLDVQLEFERLTYRRVFEKYTGIDPHGASVDQLHGYVAQCSSVNVEGMHLADRDAWLDLIMSHMIEPQLGRERPTFIYDYPASKAALAVVRGVSPPVAERFELYVNGIELANGFHELTDPREQRQRFEHERVERLAWNLPKIDPDERLLAALGHGLPPCAGVALGLDRLLIIREKAGSIREVLSFPIEQA